MRGRSSITINRNPESLPKWPTIFVTVIAFAVYIMTLSPGVSWGHHSEDTGDLITAAWVLGIPHPTGYPLFCMLGWIWSHTVAIGSVAWRMNLLSALWAALASGIMARAVWSSLRLLPSESLEKIPRYARIIASISSGLTLALATDTWKLAVVSEVYTLNLFFISLISWILIELVLAARESEQIEDESEAGRKWGEKRRRLVILLGFTWGLALTNHLTSLFLLPGILIILAYGKIRIRFKTYLAGAGMTALALLLYLYLPIRSAMNPPLDWGNPETVGNFIWVVTGKQFRRLMFTMLPYQMLGRVLWYSSVPGEIGVPAGLLSLMGLCRLILAKGRHLILILIYTVLLVASGFLYLTSYSIWDPEGYLLPMLWAISFWAGWGIAMATLVPKEAVKFTSGLLILLLITAPIVSMVSHWTEVDLSANHDAMRFGEESFANFDKNALVIEVRYERAFTLWYYGEVEYAKSRPDVAVIYVEHMQFDWGLDLFRRKYPDLTIPDAPLRGGVPDQINAAWIIEHNIDKRPIYSGAMFDELVEKGYRFEGVGIMFRVLPPVDR